MIALLRICALIMLSLLSLNAEAGDEVTSPRLDKLFSTESNPQPQFTEQRWKAKPVPGVEFPRNRRLSMLPDLVHKYALIGLSVHELSDLLGEPESINGSKEHLAYELNFPACNSSPRFYFEIEFKQDHVLRFRVKEINPLPEGVISYSNWITSNFQL